ncbi:hypothetical protein EYF80_000852 [Liparis tanakae]|uniref:Uncharacterized protein n=1 Tax=Liparis tanakae TaxID=230148 RepID=A0A4Z2JGV3_9TELE|nr:hypothetical protein EYF80_000852 [Liparis tanakae]
MASKSMTFSGPLKNFHLSGEERNRRTYSMVNQAIHTASTWASCGLSLAWPNSSVTWSSDIRIHIGSGLEESFRGQIIKDRGEL